MPLSLSETLFRPEFIDAENRTILSAEFIYPFFFEYPVFSIKRRITACLLGPLHRESVLRHYLKVLRL